MHDHISQTFRYNTVFSIIYIIQACLPDWLSAIYIFNNISNSAKAKNEKNGSNKQCKLNTSLTTAVHNNGTLDKEATSHNDVFDAFRLSLKFYHFKDANDKD